MKTSPGAFAVAGLLSSWPLAALAPRGGFALREGATDYDLTRDAVSLDTPDGKTIPLPSITESRKADVRALQSRERVQRDPINYFPPNAHRACKFLEKNYRDIEKQVEEAFKRKS